MFESQFELFDATVSGVMYSDPNEYFDEFYSDTVDMAAASDALVHENYGNMLGIVQEDEIEVTQVYESNADVQETIPLLNIENKDELSSTQSEIIDPLKRVLDDVYYFFTGNTDIVTENHFNSDGTFDEKNNLIVEGNVAHDLQFTQQQTHGSCSLMAQEQFVHRYTGQAVPEEYLEWQAEKWGVYSPDLGTNEDGQVMVLEHFNIPHDRIFDADTSDIDNAISTGNDVIIGVDAREFYDDSSIPPESGHAVAIVGRGIDPETSEVAGYYVTDSNYPESARFVSVDKIESSMLGDMITIPEKKIA